MRGSDRFTERASTAITKAHEAAAALGHSYVGTEHLLMGIVRERDGLGARVLAGYPLNTTAKSKKPKGFEISTYKSNVSPDSISTSVKKPKFKLVSST